PPATARSPPPRWSASRAVPPPRSAAGTRGSGRASTRSPRGLADSTIVVLTADHGEEFQEHGHLKHRIHLYDELLRVPLVIAGPGVRPGRSRSRRRALTSSRPAPR